VNFRSIFVRVLVTILVLYVAAGMLLFFYQKKVIYQPGEQSFEDCAPLEKYEKIAYNGTRFYLKQQSDEAIVFYHGNGGSACGRSERLAPLFESSGKSVLFVEYAGYAGEKRQTSKKLILQDVKNVVNFLNQNNYKNITIVGESIGTGAASYHSFLQSPERMILISPFTSIKDIATSTFYMFPTSIILTEDYTNDIWLNEYSKELLIIHGKEDKAISPALSKRLFENVPSLNKTYIEVDGATHNDLYSFDEVMEKMKEFI